MTDPKDLDEFPVGDLGRIEIDLDGFAVIADVAVGGIGRAAARIAYPGTDDAWETPVPGVWTPESTERKGGGFDLPWRSEVDGREGGLAHRATLGGTSHKGNKQGGDGGRPRRRDMGR